MKTAVIILRLILGYPFVIVGGLLAAIGAGLVWFGMTVGEIPGEPESEQY